MRLVSVEVTACMADVKPGDNLSAFAERVHRALDPFKVGRPYMAGQPVFEVRDSGSADARVCMLLSITFPQGGEK